MSEKVLLKSKRMLRKLESVTSSMPPDWFTYRNYAVKDAGSSANARSVEVQDGVVTHHYAGRYTWRFTGNLASAEFQEALVGKLPNEGADKEAPTRVQPPRTAKGNKAHNKVPAKQRRLQRL